MDHANYRDTLDDKTFDIDIFLFYATSIVDL